MVNYLAMDAGGVTEEVEGIPTTEPAFGLGVVVSADVREHAEYAGYTVVMHLRCWQRTLQRSSAPTPLSSWAARKRRPSSMDSRPALAVSTS